MNMNAYSNPSSITMQRAGDRPVTITLEDAVVILTNQQKTIEELIVNNQRMFQYIQEAQRVGGNFGNIQFAQHNLSDPASHIYNNNGFGNNGFGNNGFGGSAPNVAPASASANRRPMTLSEYLASKKTDSTSPAPSTPSSGTGSGISAPMTLSEYLAKKNSNTAAPESMATPPAAAPATTAAPMTLSEFLAKKKSGSAAAADDVPVFDTPSKTDPVV